MTKMLKSFLAQLGSALALCCASASAEDAKDPGPAIYASEAAGVIRIHAVGVKADGTMDGDDGTGFVISQTGYVLTASHVVPDQAAYQTVLLGGYFGPATGGGKPYRLTLAARSDNYDAALLKIEDAHPQLTVLPLRKTSAAVGELLFVLGYPLGLPNTYFLDGRVGAVTNDALTTNALIDAGNSGGPVLDANGCVVGVVFGGIMSHEGQPVNGIKFAVPLKSLADFIPAEAWRSADDSKSTARNIGAIHVTDTLSRTQTDHNALRDIVRQYHDVIAAREGFAIDTVEAVGKNSLNPPSLPFPTPVVAGDGTSMSFDYSLVSGPIFDQRRGWIDMTISTRQHPIGTPLATPPRACP